MLFGCCEIRVSPAPIWRPTCLSGSNSPVNDAPETRNTLKIYLFSGNLVTETGSLKSVHTAIHPADSRLSLWIGFFMCEMQGLSAIATGLF